MAHQRSWRFLLAALVPGVSSCLGLEGILDLDFSQPKPTQSQPYPDTKTQFARLVKGSLDPVPSASLLTGHSGRYEVLRTQSQMPHLSPREKLSAIFEATNELTVQVGSPDYVLVGSIHCGGNAFSTLEFVNKTMLEHSAALGADVVLVTGTGVSAVPFSTTLPGYVNTNSRGYSSLNPTSNGVEVYSRSSGTAEVMPSQKVDMTLHLPHSSGFALRFLPGSSKVIPRALALDDARLAEFYRVSEGLESRSDLSVQEIQRRKETLLDQLEGKGGGAARRTETFEEWSSRNASPETP